MKSQPSRNLADTSRFVMTCHASRMANAGRLRPELQAAVGKVLAACDSVPTGLPEPMAATVAAIRAVHAKARPQWLIDLEEYEAADAKLKRAQAERDQYRAETGCVFEGFREPTPAPVRPHFESYQPMKKRVNIHE